MTHTLVVLYDDFQFNKELEIKLSVLGDSYIIWKNTYIIKTELNSKELYDKLKRKSSNYRNIFIAEIINEEDSGYYGFMRKEVWDWLKDKQ